MGRVTDESMSALFIVFYPFLKGYLEDFEYHTRWSKYISPHSCC